MEKTKQLSLAFLAAALLGLNLTLPALAQDGGDDGGFDDGGFEDDGMDEPGTATTIRTRTAMGSRTRIRMGMGVGTATRGGTDTMEIITIMSIHIMAAGRPGVSALVRSGDAPPYYPPAYGYPPAAGRFVPPAVYIERKDTAQPATESQANYWHYCRSAEGYYPYVKECPDGWEQVAPTPPQAGKEDQE